MPRFLSQTDAQQIEHLIDLTLEEIDDNNPHYDTLNRAYYSFEPQSNSAATIAHVEAAIRLVNPGRADALALFVFNRIRASNYPSGWNPAAQLARNTYVATHPGTNPASWRCPGAGVPAHDATLADVTIDHIVPVAHHWNNGGNNTSSHARAMWYQDTSNHAYLCRACNSRRGSGGIRYTIAVGAGYSN